MNSEVKRSIMNYMVHLLSLVVMATSGFRPTSRPNIVIFIADDLGWGDLSVFGHPTQEPGAVDRMAAEGIRFTQWYAAASLCTPSRSALLTGRQPYRSGMYGPVRVLLPPHGVGLSHDEVTIAEALRDFAGYTTGIVGKWHLGINEAKYDDGHFLPHTHGFQYVGTIIPFTLSWNCDTSKRHKSRPSRRGCFLYRNTTIIEQPIDLESLTSKLIMDANAFIYNNQQNPFFLLFSLPQTHTPMFNHPAFKGKSKRGVYGDQVNEMSWAIGEVLNVIRELHLEENTIALFFSDHGPHLEICEEGGSPGPFREGKCYYGEGALRIPAVAWWPGTISPGQVSTSVISLLDIFPTLLDLAGVPRHVVRWTLDGRSRLDDLLGFTTTSRQDTDADIIYFYCDVFLVAARVGAYKVYFRKTLFPDDHQLRQFCSEGFPLTNFMMMHCPKLLLRPWLVYNVESDPGELWPLSVERLGVDVISTLSNKLENPPDDFRPPLLTFRNIHRGVSPCCNPPYCVCDNW